jgi:hypothetical protein
MKEELRGVLSLVDRRETRRERSRGRRGKAGLLHVHATNHYCKKRGIPFAGEERLSLGSTTL